MLVQIIFAYRFPLKNVVVVLRYPANYLIKDVFNGVLVLHIKERHNAHESAQHECFTDNSGPHSSKPHPWYFIIPINLSMLLLLYRYNMYAIST